MTMKKCSININMQLFFLIFCHTQSNNEKILVSKAGS